MSLRSIFFWKKTGIVGSSHVLFSVTHFVTFCCNSDFFCSNSWITMTYMFFYRANRTCHEGWIHYPCQMAIYSLIYSAMQTVKIIKWWNDQCATTNINLPATPDNWGSPEMWLVMFIQFWIASKVDMDMGGVWADLKVSCTNSHAHLPWGRKLLNIH